jgi:hypothetical protein
MLTNEHVPDQDVVQRTSLELLQALDRSRSRADRILLTLAARAVLGRLRIEGTTVLEGRPEIAPILAYGVTFDESPYDEGIWYFGKGPRNGVRPESSDRPWAELVAVESIDAGGDCEGVGYRDVIRDGIRWLDTHQSSPLAPRVVFDVAQAYETWWSLSLAPDTEDLVTVSDHKAGAARARLQAIDWYRRLLRQSPLIPEARVARQALTMLTLGVDTGARRFYCVYA